MATPSVRCMNPFCRREIPALTGEVRPPRVCAQCAQRALRVVKVVKDVGLKTGARALGRHLEEEHPVAFGAARDAYRGWKRAEGEANAPPHAQRAIEVEVVTEVRERRKGAA